MQRQELEKDRLDLASQNQALAAELERLKLSAAKKKKVKGKSELDRFVDLRILARMWPHNLLRSQIFPFI